MQRGSKEACKRYALKGNNAVGQGSAASKQYNACIRRHTLKTAILDQLKNTKSVFRDVMQRHCLRKRAKLMAQCERSLPKHCLNPTV